MSAIRRLGRVPDAAWDAFVTAHPEGTVCHLSNWAVVAETLYGWKPHYLAAESDGVILGVLPLVHVRPGFGRGALVSTPLRAIAQPQTRSTRPPRISLAS